MRAWPSPNTSLVQGGAREFWSSAESYLCTFTAASQPRCSCSRGHWVVLLEAAVKESRPGFPPCGSLGCVPQGAVEARAEAGVAAAGLRLGVRITVRSRRPPPCPGHSELLRTLTGAKNKCLSSRDSRLSSVFSVAPPAAMLLFRGRKSFSEVSPRLPPLG